MIKSEIWNDAAKNGVLLGVLMASGKILEQSMVLSADSKLIGYVVVEWLIFAALFSVVLFYATKKYSHKFSVEEGFTFGQALQYNILVAALASVLVAFANYVYINSYIGYDNYIEQSINSLSMVISSSGVDSSVASIYDTMFDEMKDAPKPSILSALIGTVMQYVFAGLFVGSIIAKITSRKPQLFDNSASDNE